MMGRMMKEVTAAAINFQIVDMASFSIDMVPIELKRILCLLVTVQAERRKKIELKKIKIRPTFFTKYFGSYIDKIM